MSDKPQWTPGPWFNGVGNDRFIWAGRNAGHACIAVVGHLDDGRPSTEEIANAHLIAAAPEMYEALKRQQANIRRWLETGVAADPKESKSISDQIDAALAKAEGRT